MNASLSRIHLGLASVYAILAIGTCAIHLSSPEAGIEEAALLVAFCAIPLSLHVFAYRGARAGKPWGRRLSRLIGVLMLFGFPIGTLLGGLILLRAGKNRWQSAGISG